MKKKFLPLGFFILIAGIASVLLSATLIDNDKRPKVKNETALNYIAQLRNNQNTGKLDPNNVIEVRSQIEKSKTLKSGNENNYNWDLAGPNNLGGRTRALIFDNSDPDGNIIYAGSVMGGLFKSTNAGNSWAKINEAGGDLNVSCMIQAANGEIYVGTGEGFNQKNYTILKDWGYDYGFIGTGLYKSTDGENFNQIASTTPVMNEGVLEWGFINELAISPAGDRIYASTNTGLKYSDDGGSTWNFAKTDQNEDLNILSQDVKIGPDGLVVTEVNGLCYVSSDGNPNNFVLHSTDSTYDLPNNNIGRIEFAIAPSNGDIIYALLVKGSGALKGVYISSDRGINWSIVGPGGSSNFNVFNINSDTLSGIGLNTCAITVFPNDPYQILIGGTNMWYGYKVLETGYYNWIRSSDGSINDPQNTIFLPYYHHIYLFRPGHSDELIAGTNGGIYMGTISPSLFTFTSINKNYIGAQFQTVGITKEKTKVYGGAQDLGTLLIPGSTFPSDPHRGTDIWTLDLGTISVPDGGNGGYVVNSTIFPEALVYSKFLVNINGTIFNDVRRNEYGGFANSSSTLFDDKYQSNSLASPFLLWESYNNPNTRDSVKFKAFKDYQAGTTIWAASRNHSYPFKYTLQSNLPKGDSIMIKDIVNTKFFIGGDNRVLLTPDIIQFDHAPRWFEISNASTGFSGRPQSMAYSADANHLFVGTQNGKLYRISNIAYAYDSLRADVNSSYCIISTTRIPVFVPGTSDEITQVITSVSVDPNNANRVIITLGNYGNDAYVYFSTNALAENPEFHSIQGDPNNGGLPLMPAYASLIEMDPNNHLVFVGSEYGIYVSDNVDSSNPTWVSQNKNIGHVPVFMLKQQTIRKESEIVDIGIVDTIYQVYPGNNNYGVIYGATYGRGIIILDEFQKPVGIFGPSSPIADITSISIYPNPAKDNITVSFTLDQASNSELKVYDLNGRLLKDVKLGRLDKGKQLLNQNVADLPKGTYMLQIITGQKSASAKFIIY